ncbi:E3 UFM1-protein ligase 1 like [Apostasia shenzhenica]|uniref:E3 UFM1-protein ligase 1 like n=1 Tax=Apostasia shenzhenica TaxID=1088818 RepID=A0A2H9ZSJ8_9ASPA|nr:E3 UFM1-protein ligase 1 like [Apostasia shenzhenica]
MDAELLELQRQFESAQQAKTSVRLSERNVVELVRKLQELGYIDFDLLHTVTGKEYITTEQLRLEMVEEIEKSSRVSLIDLSDVIGVDLFHIERHGRQIVASDPRLMLINGEIISESYWDGVSEEINEKLQECGQISLAELAAQLHVGSELLVSVLDCRLGTTIQGQLETGQLYTPAYVSRINAMVRGATRGITVPTNTSTVWNCVQQLLLDVSIANGVSTETALFHSIFNGLVKEREILGSLRAGVQWTPAVFAHAQRESVDSFFSQNSYIGYDVLRKLAISQPKQYLQSRYPEGIPLDSLFIHPSMVEMLDAAIQDAIEYGNWIDSLSLLPVYVEGQDVSKILSFCPSVQRAVKSSNAIMVGESCIFSSTFIKGLFDLIEKDMDIFSFIRLGGHQPEMSSSKEVKFENRPGSDSENMEVADDGCSNKHTKKKRGKSARAGQPENDPDIHESFPTKGKRNQRKPKDAGSIDQKSSRKVKEASLNGPSERWIAEKILTIAPDLGESGGPADPEAMVSNLASYLRPMLLESLDRTRTTLLQENAKRSRQLLDSLQKQLDVVMDNKLKHGIEINDSENADAGQLTSGSRITLAKSLPASLSVKAQAAVEALEGKRVDTFMAALKALVEESGLLLKKLDKKLERTLLHSYQKDLVSQVSSEADPIVLLPKVVGLFYLQVYNKSLQAPGRAISSAISRLKDKLPEETFNFLMDYHNATVTLLALQAAATEDVGQSYTTDLLGILSPLCTAESANLPGANPLIAWIVVE